MRLRVNINTGIEAHSMSVLEKAIEECFTRLLSCGRALGILHADEEIASSNHICHELNFVYMCFAMRLVVRYCGNIAFVWLTCLAL